MQIQLNFLQRFLLMSYTLGVRASGYQELIYIININKLSRKC